MGVSILNQEGSFTNSFTFSLLSRSRAIASRSFAEVSAIDNDKSLSREGKELKRKEIANKAIADLEEIEVARRG